MAVLNAGWPHDAASGVTLNRFCGSGQQAVNFAALGVMAGQQDLVVGGGVESMSRCPMGADGSGIDGRNPGLVERHPLVPQGISADLIATVEGFSRAELDAFAAESQRRCAIALVETTSSSAARPGSSARTAAGASSAREPRRSPCAAMARRCAWRAR